MEKSEENVVPLKKLVRRQADLKAHPFYRIIERWIKVISGAVEITEEEKDLSWKFSTDRGIAGFISIYRMGEDEEVFFWMECALAVTIPSKNEQIFEWMLKRNHSFHHIFKLAVNDNVLVVQSRSYCDGVTPEHFRLRLVTLIPFAIHIFDELQRCFDLKPYLSENFILKK